jgi:hypothetical protein
MAIAAEDKIAFSQFEETGITEADTLDTWRKKTNGIIEYLSSAVAIEPFAHCVMKRSETTATSGIDTSMYWYIEDEQTTKNIDSINFTAGANNLEFQFTTPRDHSNHIVVGTWGKTQQDDGRIGLYGTQNVLSLGDQGTFFPINPSTTGITISSWYGYSYYIYNDGDHKAVTFTGVFSYNQVSQADRLSISIY